jgi:hypothetical protein
MGVAGGRKCGGGAGQDVGDAEGPQAGEEGGVECGAEGGWSGDRRAPAVGDSDGAVGEGLDVDLAAVLGAIARAAEAVILQDARAAAAAHLVAVVVLDGERGAAAGDHADLAVAPADAVEGVGGDSAATAAVES